MIKPTVTLIAIATAFVLVGCASAGDYHHSYRVTAPCTTYSYGNSYGGHHTQYTTTRSHYAQASYGHRNTHRSHQAHSYSHRPTHSYTQTYSSRPSYSYGHSYSSSYRPTYGCSSSRFSYHY
jgi:hypothetical protein